MAKEKISELAAAAALDGTELVPIVQGGETVQTTTQDIADLGGGGGITIPSLVAGDILVASGVNTLAALTIGSPAQQLRVNAGGTALEYFTASVASGDITNGGNTTGAAISIGTNDDYALNLKTSGITRMAITGGTGTGGAFTITNGNALTNTVQDVLTIQANSSGTPAASYGGGILFQGKSSTTNDRDMARLSAIWTTATDAGRTSALVYSNVNSGGAITERFRFAHDAMTMATSYTIGNSGNQLIIGGSSGLTRIGGATGQIQIYSSSNTSDAIFFGSTGNAGTDIGGVVTTNTTFTQTSSTRNFFDFRQSFAPASGTAVHNALVFSGTFNQTGGANGITRAIYLNQTLTAVADFRGLEIAYSNANAKGIYQTGANTKNTFVGATGFGATTAPTDIVEITGNLALLVAGNKIKIATGANASTGTSAAMTAGSITISTTAVTASSQIFAIHATVGGTQGILSVGTVTPGTSFVINSSNAADTGTLHWWVIN